MTLPRASWLLLLAAAMQAQTPDQVLLIVNRESKEARQIGEHYAKVRRIPDTNVCRVTAPLEESVSRDDYEEWIAKPVMKCLKGRKLTEQVLYLVTTLGMPLRVQGTGDVSGTLASVDSELAVLYWRINGREPELRGPVRNPYFAAAGKMRHPAYPLYLVTRLAGYTVADAKALVDRCLGAKNRGVVVIDAKPDPGSGDDWLRRAADRVPRERLVLDNTYAPVYEKQDVIAYASWGSNDKAIKRRTPGFGWLPGAIMTEFVSSDGRTFEQPPASWNIGSWQDSSTFFGGSPQSMTADYVAEGVSGASGHTDEPYLQYAPRPELLIPAWLAGRPLAEAYWLSIPAVSWRNIVLGDPLCALPAPSTSK